MSMFERVVLAEGVADTIWQQIKAGEPKMSVMAWGVKDLVGGPDFLQFGVRVKHAPGLKIKVSYNSGSDSYDVEFGQLRKHAYKVAKKIEGIYAEQLGKILDDHILGGGLKR